jgi:pimeloyl-ACP methyl ester carboxylesterase
MPFGVAGQAASPGILACLSSSQEDRALKTVASADGTLIAYDQDGTGPALVLVHGMTGSRASFALMQPGLRSQMTVAAMDRRGRGDSGDAPDYAVEREFEDVAAVVNALEPPVLLVGHSFGALCALGAATQSDRLAGLVLYEPWIALEGEALYTPEQLDQLDRLLAAGDREGVLKMLLIDIVGIPRHEVEEVLASPERNERLATAPTIPREARVEQTWRLPADAARTLTIPVLLLLGGDSPPYAARVNAMLEKALPNTRTVVMPGQQHVATRTAPDMVVEAILNFSRDLA